MMRTFVPYFADAMATGSRYPFVLRALFFAAVYTLIAVTAEVALRYHRKGAWELPGQEAVFKYFMIGICVAVFSLLFFRMRRVNVGGKR